MSIFYDNLGNFQWASVAAIIAGIGAIISLIFSALGYKNSKYTIELQKEMDQKKIDADIIAKARMEWIQSVRALSAEIIVHVGLIQSYANNSYKARWIYLVKEHEVKDGSIDFGDGLYGVSGIVETEELKNLAKKQKIELKEFQDTHLELYNLVQQLSLYFSETNEHESILALLNSIHVKNNEIAQKLKSIETKDKNLEEEINNFIKATSEYKNISESLTKEIKEYLKEQWNRAKSGK